MYDIFDIMSFYAYDIDAVTEYVETLQSESSESERG